MTVYFVTTDKKTQEDIGVPHLRPEVLDTIRMEDLIKEYLTSKENVHKIKFLCRHKQPLSLEPKLTVSSFSFCLSSSNILARDAKISSTLEPTFVSSTDEENT